jgi:uncharacterized protein
MDTEQIRRAQRDAKIGSVDGKRLEGHAIVFNTLSVDLGGFREQIAPEAVDRAINEGADVRALFDHDPGKVLGRTRAGTLSLRKDSKGLRAVIEPDLEISYARDVVRSVARGDISGMSFGFRVLSDEWDYEGKMPLRTVTDMKLSEVSIVSWPAYEATSVQARALFNLDEAVRSLDAFKKAHPQRTAQWYETRLRLAR